MARLTHRAMYLNLDMGYVLTYPELVEDAEKLYGFTSSTPVDQVFKYYEIIQTF